MGASAEIVSAKLRYLATGEDADGSGAVARVVEHSSDVRVLRTVGVSVAVDEIVFKTGEYVLGFRLLRFVVTGVDVSDARAGVGKGHRVACRAELGERVLKMPSKRRPSRTSLVSGLTPRGAVGPGGERLPRPRDFVHVLIFLGQIRFRRNHVGLRHPELIRYARVHSIPRVR